MARGRMINKTLVKSRKFHSIKKDFHRLVYLLLLPFADRDGRLEGSPRLVYINIFPLRADLLEEDVTEALSDLARTGLIFWYRVEEEYFIEIVDFAKHQQGMHYNREGDSGYPPPPKDFNQQVPIKSGFAQELLLDESGLDPREVKVEVKEKINNKEAPSSLCRTIEKMFLDKNDGKFTSYPKERKAIQGLVKKAEVAFEGGEFATGLRGMVTKFWDLRMQEEFYQKHPFLPSSLNSAGIWDRVMLQVYNSRDSRQQEINRQDGIRERQIIRDKERQEAIAGKVIDA